MVLLFLWWYFYFLPRASSPPSSSASPSSGSFAVGFFCLCTCTGGVRYINPFVHEDCFGDISPHAGVFDQGAEDHEEAYEEVDVDGLHVRDLRQRRVHRVDQGGHRQHSGHTKADLIWSHYFPQICDIFCFNSHPCGCSASIQPERNPGHDNNQA